MSIGKIMHRMSQEQWIASIGVQESFPRVISIVLLYVSIVNGKIHQPICYHETGTEITNGKIALFLLRDALRCID
jgi:hypothetical protein